MVSGTIFADTATINGCFEGEIFAKTIDILSSGNLKGEITCSEFTIEKGGIFLGTSKTVTNEEVVNLTSNTEKSSCGKSSSDNKVVDKKAIAG